MFIQFWLDSKMTEKLVSKSKRRAISVVMAICAHQFDFNCYDNYNKWKHV